MQRRRFIHATAASLLFPVAVKSRAVGLAAVAQYPDYLFFDERFYRARRLAASWTASRQVIGVQSDITTLWTKHLERDTSRRLLHLRGITTESFLFCLRILAEEHANLDLEVKRLDRNLLLWTISATPKSLTAEDRHG